MNHEVANPAFADREVTYGIGRVALGDMLRRSARRFGDKPAVIDANGTTSFAQLDEAANRFANYLLSRGIPPKSRIITVCANSAEYAMIIYGIHKAGMVWVPINTILNAQDLKYIAGHTEASLAIVDETLDSQPNIGAVLNELRVPKVLVNQSFHDLLKAQNAQEPQLEINERDLAMIMYTSGTTSLPKGVMHCHLAVYAGVMANIGEWKVDRADRILIILPMFHVAAHCLFTTFMAAGATVVLHKGFDPGNVLKTIEKEKITVYVGLPMMFAGVLDHANFKSTNVSSLRFCIYSMAPMGETLLRRIIAEFCANIALTSGQTEMYPITVMFRPEQQLQRFGNYWGEPSIVNDLELIDENGNPVPKGEVGEIVHRGPNVMLGYYKDAKATAEARKFGWHHTGDLGRLDKDGQLLFLDRRKDMIKSGGENVASAKVEQVLLKHPAIANVAVIGVPHPRWAEAVVGCVSLKPGASATPDEIIEFCKPLLGKFEVPKAVKILEKMPMTATSKLRKVELREQFLKLFEND